MFSYSKALILDIEGNSAKQANELKITQFSALLLDKDSTEEINLYNRNVNMISAFVQRLTHLTVAQLKKDGLTERNLVKKIHKLLESVDVIYGWGLEFDKRITKLMFKKYNLEPVNTKWIDVQEVAKIEIKPERLKLKFVARSLGFEEHGFHNSLIDCHAIKYIMDKIEESSKVAV